MTLSYASVHGRTPVLVGIGQQMEWGRSPAESLSPMGIAAAAGAARGGAIREARGDASGAGVSVREGAEAAARAGADSHGPTG